MRNIFDQHEYALALQEKKEHSYLEARQKLKEKAERKKRDFRRNESPWSGPYVVRKNFFVTQEHKKRLFTANESATILRLCSKLIQERGGIGAERVINALSAEEEGRSIITRVKASNLMCRNYHVSVDIS